MNENVNVNEKSSDSQRMRILDYMKSGKKITSLEALQKFGCFRLASRISDIRNDMGIDVKDEFVLLPNGKRVKEYFIEK